MGLGLALIVALAAALRLPTLGDQSLWFDEAATAADVSGSFGDMARSVKDLEGNPPFFFFVTWLVAQLLGTGEVALRLVPAVAGIADLCRRCSPPSAVSAAHVPGSWRRCWRPPRLCLSGSPRRRARTSSWSCSWC